MEPQFKFLPLNFNWVAIHPKPIGVVQFIGGAFFGTFPTIFYRAILRKLFDQGYTIIAKPYRFTFRHWSVAIGLLRDQQELIEEVAQEAKRLGYNDDLYQEYLNSEPSLGNPISKGKYFWLGHSLGCKYIALLELLSDLEETSIEQTLKNIFGEEQAEEITNALVGVDLKDVTLINQGSLLMAPVLADISNAVPIPFLAKFLQGIGLDVKPSKEKTKQFIEDAAGGNRNLFNLISVLGFKGDIRAQETITWLENYRQRFIDFEKDFDPKQASFGPHLTPLGIREVDSNLTDTAIKFIDNLKQEERILSVN